MSLGHGSRIIMPDVLSLDFSNIKSYVDGTDMVYDVSGVGGSGTLNNSPVFTNGALSFDGNSGFVRYTRSDLNGGSFQYDVITIELWYKPSTGGSSTGSNVFTIEKTFEISVADSGDGVNASIKYASNPWAWYGPNTGAFVNKWNLITYVHTLSNRTVYVNGDVVYTSGHTGALASGDASYPYITLGARYAGTSAHCVGDLGIVRMYSYPLTQQEIRKNFEAQRSRFGT